VATDVVDPTLGPLSGAIVVPEGGLRAVMFEVFIQGISKSRIHMTIDVDGDVRHSLADMSMVQTGFGSVAVTGEDLPPGAVGRVTLTAEGPAGEMMVGVDQFGELTLGTIAGADDGLRLVRAGDVTLLERTTAEFARLHDAVVVLDDPVDAAVFIAESETPRPAVADADVGLPSIPSDDALTSVETLDLDPGRIDVTTLTDRPALLVVSQNNYAGWSAEIDGTAAPVVTADGSFMGVVVPAGHHVVTFRFRPEHVTVTVAVALLAFLASLALLVNARRSTLQSDRASAR
jgi:hypothetical protein